MRNRSFLTAMISVVLCSLTVGAFAAPAGAPPKKPMMGKKMMSKKPKMMAKKPTMMAKKGSTMSGKMSKKK